MPDDIDISTHATFRQRTTLSWQRLVIAFGGLGAMVMVRMSLQGWANLSGMALILAVVPLPWILGRQAELRRAHPGALAPSTALVVTIVVLALALFTLTMVVAKLLGPF